MQDLDVWLLLDDLAAMIDHEISPAIGWVRHAANREIEEFSGSTTNAMIEALRRRVDGLVKIASASRAPAFQPIALHELLSSQVGLAYLGESLSLEAATGTDDTISTDAGLFSSILENALENAIDGIREIPSQEGNALVTYGVTDRDFWVKITNRFIGTSFEYVSVSASGRTSKAEHRGLGIRAMEIAAGRLGYSIDIRAAGGVAIFTLHGPRYV